MSKVLVPGLVLKEKLDEYHIPVAKVSQDIGLSPSAVRQLLNNKLKISIVIALRLSKYFGSPVEYWINLQTTYELSELGKDSALTDSLKKIPKAQKLPAPAKKTAPRAAAKGPKGKRGPKPGAKKAADTKTAKAPKKTKAPKAAKAPKTGAKRAGRPPKAKPAALPIL
jgi:addiction module HigA family antidote